MALHTKRLRYFRNGVHYTVNLYTTSAEAGVTYLPVRDGAITVYAALGQEDHPGKSHIRARSAAGTMALLFDPSVYPEQVYNTTTKVGSKISVWDNGFGGAKFVQLTDSARPLKDDTEHPHCVYFNGTSGAVKLIKENLTSRIVGDWTATFIIKPLAAHAADMLENTTNSVSEWGKALNWVLSPVVTPYDTISPPPWLMNGVSVGTNGIALVEHVYNTAWTSRAVSYVSVPSTSYSIITVSYVDRRATIYKNETFLRQGVVSPSTLGTSVAPEVVGSNDGSSTSANFKLLYMKLQQGGLPSDGVVALHQALKSEYSLVY